MKIMGSWGHFTAVSFAWFRQYEVCKVAVTTDHDSAAFDLGWQTIFLT